MNIGDTVKVFSSMSDYDGQTGRIVLIASAPGAPAPYVVQFGDALTEPFSERELVPLKPIEALWTHSEPLETISAPHGASQRSRTYIGRIIADRFISGERRRSLLTAWQTSSIEPIGVFKQREKRATLTLAAEGYSPCLQCGELFCEHRFKP